MNYESFPYKEEVTGSNLVAPQGFSETFTYKTQRHLKDASIM